MFPDGIAIRKSRNRAASRGASTARPAALQILYETIHNKKALFSHDASHCTKSAALGCSGLTTWAGRFTVHGSRFKVQGGCKRRDSLPETGIVVAFVP